MRSQQRIPEMIRKVAEIWERNPELRLFQLLMNCADYNNLSLYELSDEELMDRLTEMYGAESLEEIQQDTDQKQELPDWGWAD